MLKSFFREPLVQFLILGAALFGIFTFVGQWSFEKPTQIVVTAERIEALKKSFEIDSKRPPSEEETRKLIDDYVREEILVRQAEKENLVHDDQIVRLRLRQHMESANEGRANLRAATDEELNAYLQKNADLFKNKVGDPTPALADIRPTVESAWTAAQRKAARDAAYESIKSHYSVVISAEPKPSTAPAATSP